MLEKNLDQDREIHEECGVFGAFNVKHASEIAYYALHAMQHRGQQGCGIVSTDGVRLYGHRGTGMVKETFHEKELRECRGDFAIGHVLYTANSGSGSNNIQPFMFNHSTGDFGLCNNGNIVNSKQVRERLERNGSIFQSNSDTEILAHLVKKDATKSRIEAIKEALNIIKGAFAFVIITKDKLYAMRDKNGLRPLSIGKLGDGYVVSSETCAFDVIGAEFVRDILPGEIVTFSNKNTMTSTFYTDNRVNNICAMEYIYFSRPDSDVCGVNVHYSRKEAGRVLAQEAPVDADIVIGVPDSSLSAAVGYAEESGIPYEMGLIKNKYMGRTFIEPSQELRDKGVMMKLSPVRSIVKGKRIVVIDDSIVRGTTSTKIVQMLRDMGAKEVHMRIACPPMTHPCFYGVDTNTYDELISACHDDEEVRQIIGCDTLAFISSDGLKKAIGISDMCMACFNGHYPTELFDSIKDANKETKF